MSEDGTSRQLDIDAPSEGPYRQIGAILPLNAIFGRESPNILDGVSKLSSISFICKVTFQSPTE